jgi:alginate O-acetyltransferase complex protein AlgI
VISWTFAGAALVLALAPDALPRPARTLAVLVLSVAGVAMIWPVPLIGIAAAACAVWLLGTALPRLPERARRAACAAGVALVVAALVWLRGGHPARTTLVPTTAVIGLSYFSLKFIQHLIDSAGGRTTRLGLSAFLATIFFLPTWAAGPIERTDELAAKLAGPPLAWRERVLGLERIVLGLAKKLLVGNFLLAYAEPAFAEPWLFAPATLWLALYAFAFAIYLDFAGYSDIAIGSARLAGITVRENFDSPYLQADIARLWQRWHMSLTGWLRDFVFVPVARRTLRATRRPLLSQAVAQTATMVLCGLWHGVRWNFAAWGLYHAGLLVGLASLRASRRSAGASLRGVGTPVRSAATIGASAATARMRQAASVVATFHAFAFGLILFGCPLWVAARYATRMLGIDAVLGP